MKKIQIFITVVLFIFGVSCKNKVDCCHKKNSGIMISDSGLSCNLTDQKLANRKAILKEKLFKNVEQVEELENGYAFNFEEKEGFDVELMELVAAERSCCPFFEIKLHFLPYKKGISLEITGEEGVKDFLKTELLD
jgi:hypothetical protein